MTITVTISTIVIIALFNWVVGANYLFICYKPVNGSIIDFLGPWPWYVLSLEGVGLFSFLIYYLPWLIRDKLFAADVGEMEEERIKTG